MQKKANEKKIERADVTVDQIDQHQANRKTLVAILKSKKPVNGFLLLDNGKACTNFRHGITAITGKAVKTYCKEGEKTVENMAKIVEEANKAAVQIEIIDAEGNEDEVMLLEECFGLSDKEAEEVADKILSATLHTVFVSAASGLTMSVNISQLTFGTGQSVITWIHGNTLIDSL